MLYPLSYGRSARGDVTRAADQGTGGALRAPGSPDQLDVPLVVIVAAPRDVCHRSLMMPQVSLSA
jgi:hypothetical protein